MQNVIILIEETRVKISNKIENFLDKFNRYL